MLAEERGRLGQQQKAEKSIASLDVAKDEVTNLMREFDDLQSQARFGATGFGGEASRLSEWWSGLWDANAPAPAHKFASDIETLQTELPKLITGSSKSAKDERDKVARILNGIGRFTNPSIVKTQLGSVLDTIERRRQRILRGQDEEFSGGGGTTQPSGGANPYSSMSTEDVKSEFNKTFGGGQ